MTIKPGESKRSSAPPPAKRYLAAISDADPRMALPARRCAGEQQCHSQLNGTQPGRTTLGPHAAFSPLFRKLPERSEARFVYGSVAILSMRARRRYPDFTICHCVCYSTAQPACSSPKNTSTVPSAGITSIGNPPCHKATPRVTFVRPFNCNASLRMATSSVR